MKVAIRKEQVLAATSWSNSTLYEQIKAGKFPKPTKLDPAGRRVVWSADEVQAWQNRIIAARDGEA